MKGFDKDISSATISSWTKQTVILCYEPLLYKLKPMMLWDLPSRSPTSPYIQVTSHLAQQGFSCGRSYSHNTVLHSCYFQGASLKGLNPYLSSPTSEEIKKGGREQPGRVMNDFTVNRPVGPNDAPLRPTSIPTEFQFLSKPPVFQTVVILANCPIGKILTNKKLS